MSQMILIGSANGNVYTYDTITHQLKPYSRPDKTGVMGLAKYEEHLFVASRGMITRYTDGYPSVCNGSYTNCPQFHQLLVYQRKVYITCTAINEIWIFDTDLNLLNKKLIKPPLHTKPVSLKTNYNHLNSICHYKGSFYVGLNWFTAKQYGRSGVCVLDHGMRELYRFEHGWETHGFTFVDNKQYVLCATSNAANKSVNHPLRAGLMVDGKLVFEHSTDIFCKAFVVAADRIYLFGGGIAARQQRSNVDGTIYELDRDFNLLDTYQFDGTGQFCGGMLLS